MTDKSSIAVTPKTGPRPAFVVQRHRGGRRKPVVLAEALARATAERIADAFRWSERRAAWYARRVAD